MSPVAETCPTCPHLVRIARTEDDASRATQLVDRVASDIAGLLTRLARLEVLIESLSARLRENDEVDVRLVRIEMRLDSADTRDAGQRKLVYAIITSALATVTALASAIIPVLR